jgi:hypothetical protein
MTPATAASRPPALMARSAAELADELELLLELLELLEVAVLLESESPDVAVAVARPAEDVWAARPVAEGVLVDAYWLARAQNWVTWPWAWAARGSLGQLL